MISGKRGKSATPGAAVEAGALDATGTEPTAGVVPTEFDGVLGVCGVLALARAAPPQASSSKSAHSTGVSGSRDSKAESDARIARVITGFARQIDLD